ncbi:putative amidase [Lasiodiplodia theobromae]|uniref:amidase n=1 Tax=Lasiodiplodia theobromae TaxID=45133 RepID=A0A5N5D824_9PEZI|nr:putative amidase [Lasiodiplodia theobromae]
MLTPGGSSGGEGALVAFQGSPLSVGTDLGGSVRIPSLCCGVYGFKPTTSRLPYGGQQSLNAPGTDFMLACAGPISRDLKALEVLVRAVIDARPALYDSTAIDVPWRDVSRLEKRKLRIGVVQEDPVFPLHPPVRNTMDEAVRVLRSKGNELIYLDPGECHVADATEVAWKFFGLDETVFSHLKASGEPVVRSVAFINSLAAALPRRFLPDTNGMDKFKLLATLRHARAAIVDDWRKIWQNNALDVVLCPPAQSTAVEHDKFGLPPYTTLTNILDYPSCIIPFGRVTGQPNPTPFVKAPGQIAPDCMTPLDSYVSEPKLIHYSLRLSEYS